jgi:nicotinate dehydrogenase subunit B
VAHGLRRNGPSLTRRQFGIAAGALTIAFSLAPAAAGEPAKLPGSLDRNRMLDAWLRLDATGAVTVYTGKVELGQGILTAFEQIVADELDVAPKRIRIISGDTKETPDEGFTSGSQSIEYGGTALRHVCAEARRILVDLALKRSRLEGKVADSEIMVVDGTILLGSPRRKVTYWQLAGEARRELHREATGTVSPKPPEAHQLIGTSRPRRDIPAKVMGEPAYIQDMRLPGMLFGRILRPPSYTADLFTVDTARVETLPGVVAVVRDGRFLGVLATREEQAIAAREALRSAAAWRAGTPLPASGKIIDAIQAFRNDVREISEKGEGQDLPNQPNWRSLVARYSRPFIAHASIGPSCALAQMREGRLTVWTHSQGVFPLRRDLGKALDLDESKIRVIHVQGSGCYGHNGADDAALDAALLARAANGRPVKLQWMRDDEFAWEPYGPGMVASVGARLDEHGKIVAWGYDVHSNTHSTRPGQHGGCNLLAAWHLANPKSPSPPELIPLPAGGGDRNAIPLYDFPWQKVLHHFIRPMPIRVSALRALGGYCNVFAIESFMDELALAAGADPVEFRLRHLSDPRGRAVIEAVTKEAGWTPRAPGGNGEGRGLGFAKYKNLSAYVAVVAEVTVDRDSGAVHVMKAWAAIDAGQTVNPDGLINQTEGGIVQATSWTLKEEVAFDANGIISRDWSSYPILTFPELPEIKVTVIDRPGERSLGAGEAAQGPTAAAIANAVAHAAGARIRDLPLLPERVKTALG